MFMMYQFPAVHSNENFTHSKHTKTESKTGEKTTRDTHEEGE